jgi:Rit1 N-terminal domain
MNEIVFEKAFPFIPPPWLSLSVTSQINARLPSMVASVSPSLKSMIRALLKPLLKYPYKPIWVAPDEDGVMEWSGGDCELFLDACHLSSHTDADDDKDDDGRAGDDDDAATGAGAGDGTSAASGPRVSPLGAPNSLDFTPLVLLSCSPVRSQNTHSAHHSWKYIQGAGDDEENWSAGLGSEVFWKNKDRILASDDPLEV